MPSLRSLSKASLIAAAAVLTIGIGSLALSVERPLTADQWAAWQSGDAAPRTVFTGSDDPASRGWSYETYLAAKSEANRAMGACGLTSMNGMVCPLGGMSAPLNWLGLLLAAIGVGAFMRLRIGERSDGRYA